MKVNLGKIVPQKGVDYFDGKDGIGIKKIEIKDDNLIITLTDNKKINLGKVVGKDGKNGSSGRNGRDATINGENTLTIKAGENIEIYQNENELTITGKNGSNSAIDVSYKDNYGYGGENVQDALDMAFATLDDTPVYSDLNNYVSYSTQSKTTTQQNQARKNIGIPNACVLYNQNQSLSETNKATARSNIGAKRDIIELGVIDLSDYDDDLYTFMSTLVNDGEYHFQDSWDNYDYYLKVTRVGYLLGQEYCGSEEGYAAKYFRSGYIHYSDGSIYWDNWRMLVDTSHLSSYAPKNHVHYTYVTTSLSIRSYLDANFNDGETRINSTSAKEEYRTEAGYFNTTVNGVSYYRRFQRYYSISEPWIIYSRFGLYNPNTKKITWEAWHVIEGVEE